MKRMIFTLLLAMATAFSPIKAESSMGGKTAARVAKNHSLKSVHKINPEILRRDWIRDQNSKVRKLAQERRVFRYTTEKRAIQELNKGIFPQSHMTSRVHRGRPMTPERAQKKYGLPTKPQVRETIRLPKGHPVRFNKTMGGAPGVGEITSPKQIPPKSIEKVIPLQ